MDKIAKYSAFVAFLLVAIVFSLLTLGGAIEEVENTYPTVSNGQEIVYYNWKYKNNSGILVNAVNDLHCSWKPDHLNDGYKRCEAVIEIENLGESKPILTNLRTEIVLSQYTNKTPIEYYYSNTYSWYNETYFINNSELFLPRRSWSDWINFQELSSLNINNPFAIKAVFEIPQYEANHYNFYLNDSSTNMSLAINLDPDISACGTLSTAGYTYTLTQNVSSTGTCFIITANNITLDGNGHTITYGTSGSSGSYGVTIDNYADYSIIKNSKIKQGSSSGAGNYGIRIYTGSDNNIIRNNTLETIESNSDAIYDAGSGNNQINDNLIKPRYRGITIAGTVGSDSITGNTILINYYQAHGIYLSTGGNTIQNNNINITASNSYGIYILSSGNTLINNTINTNSLNATAIYLSSNTNGNKFQDMVVKTSGSSSYAFYLASGSHNFIINDSSLNASAPGVSDIYIAGDVSGGVWNFTNVSFSDKTWSAGANGTLNYGWWLDALANYTNKSLAPNANISAWNKDNILQFNVLTGSDGRIPRQRLLEYKQNGTGGAIITYYSNYTFNATSPLGIEVLTQSWNMTQNRFLVFTFDGTAPVITILAPRFIPPYNTMPIPFNVSLNEPGRCNYTLNNGIINYTMTANASNTGFNATNNSIGDGNYTVRYYCWDFAGNFKKAQRNFRVDTTPPNVTLISPADNSISTNTNVTFVCNVTDNVGLRNVSLYLTKLTKVAYFRENAAPTNVTNDTFLNASSPNSNYGSVQRLKVDNSPNLNTLVRFPNIFGDGNDQIPLGSEIVSAELTFRCTNLGNLINAYRLKEDWVESEATWNSRIAGTPWSDSGAEGPVSADMTYYETLNCAFDNSWVNLDATKFVQNWSNGDSNYGILLNNTGNDGVDLNSSEALPENTRPLLKVTYLYETDWKINQTLEIRGIQNLTQFNVTLEDNSTYKWNCLAYDNAGNEDWGDSNFTIHIPTLIGFYQYPTISFYNETTEIILFEANMEVNGTVEYWPEDDPNAIQVKNLPDISPVHEFNITGLTKGTRYGYRINIINNSGNQWYSDIFNSSFKTPDYSVTSFKFVVVGDMRAQSGTGVQADIFSNITARILDINPDLVINVGDVVEAGADNYNTARDAWKEYTDVVWNLTDHIPNFISIGNHENPGQQNSLRRYREVVIHPLNGNGSYTCDNSNTAPCWNETTYWFRYGNSLFISLNSDEKNNRNNITGNQLVWLNKTLNMSGFTNKFVFLHKPIKGENVVFNETVLDQMFDYYNVTAVFAGDKHYYCRNNTATLYLISGGGGAPLVSAANCKAADNDNAKVSTFHFVNITVNGNTIYGNAINMSNGAVLDTFQWTTPS